MLVCIDGTMGKSASMVTSSITNKDLHSAARNLAQALN